MPQFLISLSLISLLLFFTASILLALALIPIKHLIKTNKSNGQKLTELKKWKTDANLFITQWQQEQQIDTAIWQNDLVIGSPDAPILITVACNPYCGPCAQAHGQLDNMLEKFAGKLAVQVRLLCNPAKENDTRTIAVKAILQKAAVIKNDKELQQMLTDWFEWMDFEKWNIKWKREEDANVTEMLHQHAGWINKSAIAFTPTFFINGKKLPGRYNLKDLEMLLPQLAGVLKQYTVK